MKKGSFIDITGERFGRLTAINRCGKVGGKTLWRCVCDCGNTTDVTISNLRNGHTQSCGCLCAEKTRAVKTTHGGKSTSNPDRLYAVWRAMKQRCYRPENRAYRYYGAKGVTVCDEWRDSYEAFRSWSLANGYDEKAKRGDCTIDRINCAGNYEPDNCRWVNMTVQAHNKREDA